MSEWIEYTGSSDHIAEMKNSKDGYMLRKINGKEVFFLSVEFRPNLANVTHYLICNPHPLADMICQQARTGQPVYIKTTIYLEHYGDCVSYMETTTPDWNIPNAEYAFTEFKEEV